MCVCVFVCARACVWELALLPNHTASETLFQQTASGAKCLLGEYVTFDKTFYNLLFEQEAVAAPVTSTFSS